MSSIILLTHILDFGYTYRVHCKYTKYTFELCTCIKYSVCTIHDICHYLKFNVYHKTILFYEFTVNTYQFVESTLSLFHIKNKQLFFCL